MANHGLTEKQLNKYKQDGFLVVEDFFSTLECDTLIKACSKLVDNFDFSEYTHKFSTEQKIQERTADDYFLTSGDKVRYFMETGAFADDGSLVVPKDKAINKIGHALHALVPEFKDFTFSAKVKEVVRSLGFVKPAVVQSMYIFKQPRIGGVVTCHQDVTFLHTIPENRVLGLWTPLQDATLTNGCLHFIPGSHKFDIDNDRRFVRNLHPEAGDTRILKFTAELVNRDEKEFVAVPMNRGSLALIDGLVVHKSNPNLSDKSRHAYTFHLFETDQTRWSPENWLQPTAQLPFTQMY